MPVDLDLIRRSGGTPEHLEEIFKTKNLIKDSPLKELVERGSSRINDGILQNYRDARLYWAIDRAYDVSQRQITYTLVEGLLDSKQSSDQVMSAVKSWGLDKMMVKTSSCDKKGNPLWKLDLPTFFTIYVPAVMAYTKVRWAKLFNERNQYPLYKYEPLKVTTEDRLRTEIITDRIQRMSGEMGYAEVEKQSILQMLLYGQCVNFPSEDWYKEEQGFGPKGKKRVIREGIRYSTPHPTRTFMDVNYPATSINTDTGVEWMGYWDILRYSDIKHNQRYWNRNEISAGYGKYSCAERVDVSQRTLHVDGGL